MMEGKDDVNIIWIHAWLAGIYQGVFQSYMDIWKLTSPERWEGYKLLGIHDLPEIKMLAKAKELFNKAWSKTYPYRTRNRNNVQPKVMPGVPGGVSCNGINASVEDATRSHVGGILPPASEGVSCESD